MVQPLGALVRLESAPDGEIMVFIPGHIESPIADPVNPLDEVLLNAPQGKAAR